MLGKLSHHQTQLIGAVVVAQLVDEHIEKKRPGMALFKKTPLNERPQRYLLVKQKVVFRSAEENKELCKNISSKFLLKSTKEFCLCLLTGQNQFFVPHINHFLPWSKCDHWGRPLDSLNAEICRGFDLVFTDI